MKPLEKMEKEIIILTFHNFYNHTVMYLYVWLLHWKIISNKEESSWIAAADRPLQAFNSFETDELMYSPAA